MPIEKKYTRQSGSDIERVKLNIDQAFPPNTRARTEIDVFLSVNKGKIIKPISIANLPDVAALLKVKKNTVVKTTYRRVIGKIVGLHNFEIKSRLKK